MNKEDFIPLLEMQAIEKKLSRLNDEISKENSRFDHLNKLSLKNENKRQVAENDLLKNQADQKIHHSKLDNLSKTLKNAEIELMKVKTNEALKKAELETSRLKSEIDQLESAVLELLDQEENLICCIDETVVFDKNFKDTYDEIKNEIYNDNKKVFTEIDSLKEHYEYLKSNLPQETFNAYEQIKALKGNPLSFLSNGHCGQCKTAIDRQSLQEIESFNSLITCLTCGRILISPEVQY
ncbi:MAG: hypothetical protein CME61_06820 [Halobacteriovoraceae bacterium]|nr:hypothetical protein [Halobacteriovoraceae bacterium]